MNKSIETKLRKLKKITDGAERIQPKFKPGDKVMINAEKMMKNDNYKALGAGYRAFVESNRGNVFTVVYDSGFVTFEENKTWLFAQEDLVAAEQERA